MTFQSKPWNNPRETPAQWAEFARLDLPHATIVKRKGRDVVALKPTTRGFILYRADSPTAPDTPSPSPSPSSRRSEAPQQAFGGVPADE